VLNVVQWLADLSFNQGVGGSVPALIDVSLSKTLNPEFLPVAVSTVYECNMIVSRFGSNISVISLNWDHFYKIMKIPQKYHIRMQRREGTSAKKVPL